MNNSETPTFSEEQIEEIREKARELLALWIKEVRTLFLVNGANPKTHWDRIQAVIESQARQTIKIRVWMDRSAKFLQICSPSEQLAIASEAIVNFVHDEVVFLDTTTARERWLCDIIRTEALFLIAMVRNMCEAQKLDSNKKSGGKFKTKTKPQDSQNESKTTTQTEGNDNETYSLF